MALLKNIPTSQLSDEELLASFRQTDRQEELAELFLRYSDLVYGTCVKYLVDQELAKDAVMDIYQELVSKAKQHTVGNFKGWLYVLAKNHCLMKIRKNKKNPLTAFNPDVMQSGEFSHLEEVMEKELQLDRMNGCIETLQEDQRKTVKLFYLENKCYNDISVITGLEWNKVRSMIQNGRRNLKICMDKNG